MTVPATPHLSNLNPTSSLLGELVRQVRGCTIDLLTATRDEWLTWAPSGTSNHILWHAGHGVWLQDVLCVQLITGQTELPGGWDNIFGQRGQSPRLTRQWPSKVDLLEVLHRQRDRLLALIESTELWEDRIIERVLHGLHDEARHQGEMYLLLKLCSLGNLHTSPQQQDRGEAPGQSVDVERSDR